VDRALAWNKGYPAIGGEGGNFSPGPRLPGPPAVYPTWVMRVCRLGTGLWRLPQVQAMTARATRPSYGDLGFRLPGGLPAPGTVSRCSRRAGFRELQPAVPQPLLEGLQACKACPIPRLSCGETLLPQYRAINTNTPPTSAPAPPR
jgi:hypothetical protein